MEPVCDPDSCDGAGSCTDNPPAMDGAACAQGGGDTCCTGRCILGAPAGTCNQTCDLPAVTPKRVTIINSRYFNSGHDMDLRWERVAMAQGHMVSIQDPSFLDSQANLANTDILIVASGLAPIPTNRRTAIQTFLMTGGRAVYLQSEYDCNYEPNQLFTQLVTAMGATFAWQATVPGELRPVTAFGCLSQRPETQPTLGNYWYACKGTGSGQGLEPWISKGADNLAFMMCRGGSIIVTNTDQDWLRTVTTPLTDGDALMRNILARLSFPQRCP